MTCEADLLRRGGSRTAPTATKVGSVSHYSSASACSRDGFPHPFVAPRLQLQGQLLAARSHDTAIDKDLDEVGRDVVEEALIMGDKHDGFVRPSELVDAAGDDLQRIDVQP